MAERPDVVTEEDQRPAQRAQRTQADTSSLFLHVLAAIGIEN